MRSAQLAAGGADDPNALLGGFAHVDDDVVAVLSSPSFLPPDAKELRPTAATAVFTAERRACWLAPRTVSRTAFFMKIRKVGILGDS